jgi:hypothetical protein
LVDKLHSNRHLSCNYVFDGVVGWCIEQFHSYHFVDVWGGTEEESNTRVSETLSQRMALLMSHMHVCWCVHKKVHAYFDSPYFDDIPVIPGALETLLAFKQKFDFVIVTSRWVA